MKEFFDVMFLQTGMGTAVLGGIVAVMFGGAGSAKGIRIACEQGAGAMSEKPELFGKLMVLCQRGRQCAGSRTDPGRGDSGRRRCQSSPRISAAQPRLRQNGTCR